MKPKICIIGAGPGGLSAAMILAKRFDVTLVEKDEQVGGRSQNIALGDYHFDTGPTFLMMREVLDDVFDIAGEKSEDHLDFVDLDPMYRLQFDKFSLDMTKNHDEMRKRIETQFPGQGEAFDLFLKKEKVRFDHMYDCLAKPYTKPWDLLSPALIKALPHMSIGKTVHDVLEGYFDSEELRLSFSFQTKYLGMSAWECPAAFLLLPFIEHKYGVFHVQGGLSKISEVMLDLAKKKGVKVLLKSEVKKVITKNGAAKGVVLSSGNEIAFDEVVINADFGYATTNLFEEGVLKKYSKSKVEKKKYSCSTFMLYLGLDKECDLPHHTIFFSKDYKENIKDIFQRKILTEDMSFYIRNSSVTDPNVAPKGHSAIYVLVPVPNLDAQIDWKSHVSVFREKVLDQIEKKAIKGIRDCIKVEKVISPLDWQNSYNVFKGATFNLAHTLDQMLYFRPRNEFEEVKNTWLVGGGTHPGSGLPTIYESARITSNLLFKKYGF